MVMLAKSRAAVTEPPVPRPLTQDKFNRGVIDVVGAANLPLNAAVKMDNLWLDEDGRVRIVPGHDWYGSTVPSQRVGLPTTYTNMVLNPGFEDGTATGWSNTGETLSNVSVSSIGALFGNNCLYVRGASGAATGRVHYQMTGLTIGEQYEFYAWVKTQVTAAQTITLGWGTSATAYISSTSTAIATSTWTLLHHTFIPTVSNPYIRLSSGTAGTNVGFLLDDATVGIGITDTFTGETASTTNTDYAWTGTPSASTSTKKVYALGLAEIDGAGFYITGDEIPHLVVVSGGSVFRSLDDGLTWDICTGAAFTAGYDVRMVQSGQVLRLFNGYDYEIRYTGDIALETYSRMLEPVHPSATKTGLAGTTTVKYTYYLAAVNEAGSTALSVALYDGTVNYIDSDRDRGSFDDSNYVTLKWNKGFADYNGDGIVDILDLSILSSHFYDGTIPLPIRYDLYVSENGSTPYYFDSVDASGLNAGFDLITYIDKGQSPAFSKIVGPTDNTTRGLRLGDVVPIGTRLAGTRDYDNPWRSWFSGEGDDIGKFSNAFGATYIDLQEGSQYRPVKLEEFHNGKGDAATTMWRKSADGNGDVWQGTLDTFTVGTSSFVVPNFVKLPGSRGTTAPDSVVNVLNDYMYYNQQAVFNLGTRSNFLNLLSTDEATGNVRKTVRAIKQRGSENICAYFFEAKVYISVNHDSETNNRIMVYDTERKAWLPKAFDFGVKRFLQYTDTNGILHLLCYKPGDSRLTEISEDIKGAYGEAVQTEFLSGLVHANARNRMEFAWVEEAEFELSDVDGTVAVELNGLTRESGFGTIDSRLLSQSTAPVGWTRSAWTKHAWTAGSRTAITHYSEPTMKRYFNIQQDVNCYQWRITTNTLDADYLLRMLQVPVTGSQAGSPREWELLGT